MRDLFNKGIPTSLADNQMRSRGERFDSQGKHEGTDDPLHDKQPCGQAKPFKRFSPQDFRFTGDNTCSCPAGQTLTTFGSLCTTVAGLRYKLFAANDGNCQACKLELSPTMPAQLNKPTYRSHAGKPYVTARTAPVGTYRRCVSITTEASNRTQG